MNDIIKKLEHQAQNQNLLKNHLASLLKDGNRFSKYSLKIRGFLYDFSRQCLTDDTLPILFEFAGKNNVLDRFKSMTQGEKINITENRAALHTAMRDFSGRSILLDGKDVMPQIRKVRDTIKDFSEKMRSGKLLGTTGKPLDQVVVVGIGGSYLGTECVANALSSYAKHNSSLHCLSNVDPADFARVVAEIDPE
jgi:glucose-6-phosphate isomerase